MGRRLIVCVSLLLLIRFGIAQEKVERPLKLSFGLVGYSYLGDFSDGIQMLRPIQPGVNFAILLDGPSRLQIQANGGFGKFAAQAFDADSPGRPVAQNTFVETPFFYGDLRLRYRFMLGKWEPFLAVGAGILGFSPRDASGKKLKFQDQTREEEEFYNSVIPVLPASIGIERRINSQVALGVNYTFRYTPTDYLDNVGQLGAKPGKDVLHSISLNISFTFRQPQPVATAADAPVSSLYPMDSSAAATSPDTVAMPSDTTTAPPQPVEALVSAPPEEPQSSVQTPAPPDEASMDKARMQEVRAAIAAGQFVYYRVLEGDELQRLSETFQLTPDIIRELNYLKNDRLKVGAYLKLPDCEGVPR